jgi:hypothetical protein
MDYFQDINSSGNVEAKGLPFSRLAIDRNLCTDPVPYATTGWTAEGADVGTVAMSNDVPDWAVPNTQSISITDDGDNGAANVAQLYRTLVAGSLVDGSQYTIAFWAKGSVAGMRMSCAGACMHSSPFTVFNRANFSLTTGWKFYRFTFTYTASGYAGSFRAPYFELGTNQVAGTVYLCAIMLVRGAEAPIWSPVRGMTYQPGKIIMAENLDVLGGSIGAGVAGTTRGVVTAHHGGGGNSPGVCALKSKNGTVRYLFFTDAGVLRHHTSLPTADTDGSAV